MTTPTPSNSLPGHFPKAEVTGKPVTPPAAPLPATGNFAKMTPPPSTLMAVPIATLQAIHDTLVGHTAILDALLTPKTADAATAEAALAARTAARLAQQAANGK